MSVNRRNAHTEFSKQQILNDSFDRDYMMLGNEVLTENEAGDALVRQKPIATEAKQDTLSRYQTEDFDSLTDTVYIGNQDEDGKWYIKRICISSETVDYAKGDTDYSTSWTGRTSLTYGDFNSIF